MRTAWWAKAPKPGNLGDVLTPVVLAGLGLPVRWAALGTAQILAIGSIIRFAERHHTVWGSGVMRASDRPNPRARYLAVRGPLTREAVKLAGSDCPEVYGDPALLLPFFHNDPVEKVHDVGLVPHYRDLAFYRNAGLPTISPLTANPLKVVDQIRQCRSILSSSLHGVVIAHAYGIPAAWIWTDRINGDGTKFRDHAAAVGVVLEPWKTLKDAIPVPPGPWSPELLLSALEAIR